VVPQLAGRGSCGRWRVSELAEEFVEWGLAVVDCGPLVVGEGDGGEHALEVGFGFQRQCPG
jgi:hypothetical protein